MPVDGTMSVNDDKTKDYTINAAKELDGGQVYGSLQVQGYRDTVDLMMPNAPQYNVAGAGLGFETNAGHSATISGQHIPNYGDRLCASTNINMLQTDNHKLDLNAFTATTMPKAAPNFQTQGGGIDYTFNKKYSANTSVAHTPAFKTTDYSVGGRMNLHQTPTSSLDLNLGANRRDTAFGRGNWDKKIKMYIPIVVLSILACAYAQVSMPPHYKEKYPYYYKFSKIARHSRDVMNSEVGIDRLPKYRNFRITSQESVSNTPASSNLQKLIYA